MSTVNPTPFFISIPESELLILQNKLANIRLPNELDDAGWQYGVSLADIKRLVSHWKNGYSWRKHENEINASLPQFMTDISVDGFQTLKIHFVHQRSAVKNAIPLLFVHGWPGSFLEVSKILPLLTSPPSGEGPSFHVVAFSLPGYAFSEAPKSKGFAPKQYAEVGHKLMQALGYNEYVTQGGDWGYLVITRKIAQIYGNKYCKASHTNMCYGFAPKPFSNPLLYLKHALSPYTLSQKAGIERTKWFFRRGSGYAAEQSTQPQTLGYSLDDSPVGLLAWIYEKLVNWSDDYPWTDDEILTWVSIYWFSRGGPTASLRIYYEAAQTGDWLDPSAQALSRNVPVGVSVFPKEIHLLPIAHMKTLARVVYIQAHASGGHFAAYEKPEDLADDLRKMFGRGGAAHDVVKGRSGYDIVGAKL